MLLAEEGKYSRLHEEGIIDRGLPLWWELGFEGRHYLEPERYFDELDDFEDRKVQLGPDDEDIRFTIISREVNGLELPLFVTSMPLTEGPQKWVSKDGWDDKKWLPYVKEALPHVRGIALSLDGELLFWYPTKCGLGAGVELMENELRECSCSLTPPDKYQAAFLWYSKESGLATGVEFMGSEIWDGSYLTPPAKFFSTLIGYHMLPEKKTYYNLSYKGGKWRVPKVDFVPFHEFSGNEGEAMIVPSKSRAKRLLPALVMGRGAGLPLVRGFSDSEKTYRIHKASSCIVKYYMGKRFGLECEVYGK